jgi:hypothetical protein
MRSCRPLQLLALKLWEGEGDLLIQDGSQDGETGHGEDTNEDHLATRRQLSDFDHGKRHNDKSHVRGNVKAHLENAVVLISRTLEILNRHGPVLAEGTAEYTVIRNLNNDETNSNVDKEAPHCSLELGKLTAANAS